MKIKDLVSHIIVAEVDIFTEYLSAADIALEAENSHKRLLLLRILYLPQETIDEAEIRLNQTIRPGYVIIEKGADWILALVALYDVLSERLDLNHKMTQISFCISTQCTRGITEDAQKTYQKTLDMIRNFYRLRLQQESYQYYQWLLKRINNITL